jgi:radical SAM superfamily enzyme YgiQ (UPF0313 family)
MLSFISGSILVLLSLGFYWFHVPAQISLPALIGYTAIQFRLAAPLFDLIYRSRWIDLPGWLHERFPPSGFQPECVNCDVLLLRTPSLVLSAPDSGDSLGLGYLASVLRDQEYNVGFIDARLQGLDNMQVVELILAYHPTALGVNLNFQYLEQSTASLIQAVRERGYGGHITLGGLFASVASEELLEKNPGVDTIVRFEGEQTYPELLAALDRPADWHSIAGLVYRGRNGKVITNPLRQLIPELDKLPNPARDMTPLISRLGGYAYVLSSRGCNGVCAYCVQQRSVSEPRGSRWRGRNPLAVVDEIRQIKEQYGVRLISFVDDDFFGALVNGKTHATRVAEALIAQNLDISILLSVQPRDVSYPEFALLKQAGVNSVILAVDNFSQPVLDRYRKLTSVQQNIDSLRILKSLEIDAYLGIIMFDPLTTMGELAENLEILKEIPFLRPWQILSKLEIYRGSPITNDFDQQGLLEWNGFNAYYRFQDEHIQGIYDGIEILMKILHPAMSDLDLFRWGNLHYSEADECILQYSKEELERLNISFNNQAFELAQAVLQRQRESYDPLTGPQLADAALQQEAEQLNRNTLYEIKILRDQAKRDKKQNDNNPLPAELQGAQSTHWPG